MRLIMSNGRKLMRTEMPKWTAWVVYALAVIIGSIISIAV